jgi:hypothetical protein
MKAEPAESCLPLASWAHAAPIDEDLVFLDLRTGAYLCLPGGSGDIHLLPGGRALAVADPGLREELRRAGLVGANLTAARAPIGAERPARSALRNEYGPPLWRDLPAAAASVLDLLRTYRNQDLRTIVASARRSRTLRPAQVEGDLLQAVEAFHRWVPYAPVSGKCLLRSYMLLRRLHRLGHDARWIFGVRTWPFGAHCWLESEDFILDEQPDRVRAYTPILAV